MRYLCRCQNHRQRAHLFSIYISLYRTLIIEYKTMVTFPCNELFHIHRRDYLFQSRNTNRKCFCCNESTWSERYEQMNVNGLYDDDSVRERRNYRRDNDTSFGRRSSVKEPSQPARTAARNPRRGEKNPMRMLPVSIPPLFSTGGQLDF